MLLAIWLFVASLSGADFVKSANAPALLLANELGFQVDPAQYLVSEKHDGVRALWDGKELRFRSGRPVNAPAWFIAKLPAQPLDGELWLGRGKFESLSGIVRKTEPQDEEWRQIKYLIFELPQCAGHVRSAGSAHQGNRRLDSVATAGGGGSIPRRRPRHAEKEVR